MGGGGAAVSDLKGEELLALRAGQQWVRQHLLVVRRHA